MRGVALYVTDDPRHEGFADAVMLTLTGTLVFTVIVMLFDNAGLPVAQDAFEVSLHVTKSPFMGL